MIVADWKPPIPTREEIANAKVGLSGPALLIFVEQLMPDRDLRAGFCVGNSELFDADRKSFETPQEQSKRLELALQVCAKCPVLKRCSDVVAREKKPRGVWAGKVYGRSGYVVEEAA